jgi:glutaconate CoA-transferase subunit B
MAEMAYPGTDKYSMAELYVIVIAREMAGPQIMGADFQGGGADNLLPIAARQLLLVVAARETLGQGNTLPFSNWDPRMGAGVEYRDTMINVVDRNIQSLTTSKHIPRRSGLGGIQIDKYGNLNTIGVGTHPRLKLRGPGSVGTIWNSVCPTGLWCQHHNKRVLVDRVDYISGTGWLDGWDSRYKALNGVEGPFALYTPMCFFDFPEPEHRARLVSVHPGYTVKDVLDNTGFQPVMPKNVPTTTPPNDYELGMLRTRVDKEGVLRKWKRMTVG